MLAALGSGAFGNVQEDWERPFFRPLFFHRKKERTVLDPNPRSFLSSCSWLGTDASADLLLPTESSSQTKQNTRDWIVVLPSANRLMTSLDAAGRRWLARHGGRAEGGTEESESSRRGDMDGTPTALKNGSRKCRSKSSAPLGLVHFRELFFAPSAPTNARLALPRADPAGSHRQSPGSFFSMVRCKSP